jgi:hypothetical protein
LADSKPLPGAAPRQTSMSVFNGTKLRLSPVHNSL